MTQARSEPTRVTDEVPRGVAERARADAVRGPALWAAVGLAVAAGWVLTGRDLDAIGVWAPDEPRYAQIANEVHAAEHGVGSWLLLRLNGEPYTQKPPFFFWLVAGAASLGGGVTETTARLPGMLAGLATLALTAWFVSRRLGIATGLLAALLLLTSFQFAHHARRVHLDVLLTACELVALMAFDRLDRRGGRPGAALWWLHAAMGLAVLTKGPVGFIVPTLTIGAFLAWEGRLATLRRIFPLRALAVSIGPALLWILAAVALAPAGFFGEAVVENVLGRFFAGTSHVRPFYYYTYQFPIEFLPWTLLLPSLWWTRRQALDRDADPERRRIWRLGVACVGATLAFFSLSAGKRGIYLLPAFPALAWVLADSLVLWLPRRRPSPRALGRWLGGGAAALTLLLAVPLVTGELAGARFPRPFVAAVLALIAGGTLGFRLAAQQSGLRAVSVVVATAFAIELAIFHWLHPAMDPGKSLRPIAEAAASHTPLDQRIGLLGDHAMIGGIVFYGQRRVEPLDEPDEIPGFRAAGGRTLVFKASKLDRVREIAPVTLRSRLRSGRRSVIVATLDPVPSPAPRDP